MTKSEINLSESISEITNITVKKRGRKPKKILDNIVVNIEENLEKDQQNVKNDDTINVCIINEATTNKDTVNEDITNNFIVNEDTTNNFIVNENVTNNFIVNENIVNEVIINEDIVNEDTTNEDTTNENFTDNEPQKIIKKRGRKPKGGKIIQQVTSMNNNKETKPNIILHLKCSLKDLNNNLLDKNIESFNFSSFKNNFSYEVINHHENNNYKCDENIKTKSDEQDEEKYYYSDDDKVKNKENDNKEICKKLKKLSYNLHNNNNNDKKSACFWCTYDFDNPPIYIPKYYIKESYNVYGCFCSPECATAHLMEENIDSSTKFERYFLLNHIYSKIYDYKKSIKPSPNPYYMLEKYYGNLSIQEYRSLLRNERLFLIVDKPLTRVFPELHEDNDDFVINNKIIPSSNNQIKSKIQRKQQSKGHILNEKFGISQQ